MALSVFTSWAKLRSLKITFFVFLFLFLWWFFSNLKISMGLTIFGQVTYQIWYDDIIFLIFLYFHQIFRFLHRMDCLVLTYYLMILFSKNCAQIWKIPFPAESSLKTNARSGKKIFCCSNGSGGIRQKQSLHK